MFNKVTTTFFLILLVCVGLSAQGSVRFLNNNLQSAITMAQNRDKLIFVDTYAPWCIPCKKMEKVFRDPELARYFNNTFVNIRIDMEGQNGKEVHKKYDVIFLPTMMILDSKGNVRYKVDQVMTAKDLLKTAQIIAEPEIYAIKQTEIVASSAKSIESNKSIHPKVDTPKPLPKVLEDKNNKPSSKKINDVIVSAPVLKEQKKKSSESSNARKKEPVIEGTIAESKILYVLNASEDVPPEILFQEAYFRLQLMDGSHKKTAKKYLETQEDWSTSENMNFIFDFMYSTSSKEFEYFIDNKEKFENRFGIENVRQTVEILVYDRLERGFPRPTFEEAQSLLSYLDTDNSQELAYLYYLDLIYEQGHFDSYINIANKYLELNPDDDQMYFKLAQLKRDNLNEKDGIAQCLEWIQKAININGENFLYYDLQADLYYQLDNKSEALKSAKKAKQLAHRIGRSTEDIDILIEMINELED